MSTSLTHSAPVTVPDRLIHGPEEIARLIDLLLHRTWSPWAVVLVAFKDDPQQLPGTNLHEKLFTSLGVGQLNMVDFFDQMSHGKVDTSGSHVFGWYRLDVERKDYDGNAYPQPPGKLNRDGLLNAAKAKASAAGVALGKFAGVVVVAYGTPQRGTDLCGFLGGMAAICDQNTLQPSLLGQEMGHGYGLDHARANGSDEDYRDPWDAMSTNGYPWMSADHPEFTKVGPGLNAWNMRSRGWLDEKRTWSGPPLQQFQATVELRPLHRHDLPGTLAAEIGEYLVEFRVPERWDAAIPEACVLVHRFHDNHSYLMSGASGAQALTAGDSFESGHPHFSYAPWSKVEVLHIDQERHTATIRLDYRPFLPQRPPVEGPGSLFGGIEVDGGGILILNGKAFKVPPRGPARRLIEEFARYLDTGIPPGADVAAATAGRRSALVNLIRAAAELHSEAELVSETPPGVEIPTHGTR